MKLLLALLNALRLILGPGGWHWVRNLPALFRSGKVLFGAGLAKSLGALSMVGLVHARVNRFLRYRPGMGICFGARWNGLAWVPIAFDNLGLLSARVITDAGVAFLVDDWDAGGATNDITLMNFHDSGTGTGGEVAGDTDLGTPAGPTTRATGTKSQPAANQFRSVGLISYSGTLAITEHGIFNQAARGAGTVLWDRSVFSAINVASGDSIEFTYTCTVSAGG